MASRQGTLHTIRDAGRDSFDRRDLIYSPALVALPHEQMPAWDWIHPLDQGNQGACTGFGLAAVINYQLAAGNPKKPIGPKNRVSARMLFQMAKRFDQWPGVAYDWSSARGAMKGWFKNGVCSEALWPNTPSAANSDHLTKNRQIDALRNPLGAYYRVLPRRSDVHAALVEAGAVYAVADTHDGWLQPKEAIPYQPGATGGGGHAFAIVGYTAEGFLVQNSWGPKWGGFKDRHGKAWPGVSLWRYADFDRNVWDLWVARLALPVESLSALSGWGHRPKAAGEREEAAGPSALDIRGHYLHIDDGQFDPRGDYPSHAEDLDETVQALVQGEDGEDGVPPGHLLLFAHGGLNSVAEAAIRVQSWRDVFKANGIAELHFIWETGFWAELRDILFGKQKFVESRVAGPSDWWDRWFERKTQPLGYALWKEMRTDAEDGFRDGAAGTRFLTKLIPALKEITTPPTLHLACHSAGSIWMGHLLDAWKKAEGPAIETLVCFAPACTVDFFFDHLAPHLQSGLLKQAHVFQLDDVHELGDNVGQLYRKSMLYLVSRAYQEKGRIARLLGMSNHDQEVQTRLQTMGLGGRLTHYVSGSASIDSRASSHGGFDNDVTTMNALLRLVRRGDPLRAFEARDLKGY